MATTNAHTKYIGKDGGQVPGVTTVLGILNKPALVSWANRLGLQGIDSNKYKDKMADIGTLAHLLIMNHLKGEETDTGDFTKNDIALAENCFLSYLEWEKTHPVKPVLIEKPLVSDRYNYGGTPDCIAYIEDSLELIDYKTSNALYRESFYQLAAYWQLAEEQGYKIDIARILRFGRDANEGFEERVTKNLNGEFQVFWHCLAIYNLQKEMKR